MSELPTLKGPLETKICTCCKSKCGSVVGSRSLAPWAALRACVPACLLLATWVGWCVRAYTVRGGPTLSRRSAACWPLSHAELYQLGTGVWWERKQGQGADNRPTSFMIHARKEAGREIEWCAVRCLIGRQHMLREQVGKEEKYHPPPNSLFKWPWILESRVFKAGKGNSR